MKYVIVHGEGMAGGPNRSLGGKTPLQLADTPNMDALAQSGEFGLASVPGEGLTPGAEATQLALLGYEPRKFQTGPAPFEAAGLGVALGDLDVAFRCTMVTLRPGAAPARGPSGTEIKKLVPGLILDDAQAGGIETEEARELIDAINEQLGSEAIQFYPGTRHRHFMVWVGGKVRATCVDPRTVQGRAIGDSLPTGDGADLLRQVMDAAIVILRDHPINEQRLEAGQKPVNGLWLWGQGRAVRLPKFTERYQVTGSVVAATELRRGTGICAGLDAVGPEDFAEAGHGPYAALAEAALRELGKKDFVYVHAELPEPPQPDGDPKEWVRGIEEFDRLLVGRLLDGLKASGPYRLLLLCDQAGPAGATLPAPYVLCQGPAQKEGSGRHGYNEEDAKERQGKVREASRLITRLFPGEAV